VYDRVKHIESREESQMLYDQLYDHMVYGLDEEERDEILDNYES